MKRAASVLPLLFAVGLRSRYRAVWFSRYSYRAERQLARGQMAAQLVGQWWWAQAVGVVSLRRLSNPHSQAQPSSPRQLRLTPSHPATAERDAQSICAA